MGHDGQEEILPAFDAELVLGPLCVVPVDRDQNTTTGTGSVLALTSSIIGHDIDEVTL